jgi:hypothetical protein
MKPELSLLRRPRVLVAIAAMLVILSAGAIAVLNGASPSDVGAPVLVLLLVFGFGIVRYSRRSKQMADQVAYEHLVQARHEGRAHRERGRPILGSVCPDCSNRIVLEQDGVRCSTCDVPVHNDCLERHKGAAHAAARAGA